CSLPCLYTLLTHIYITSFCFYNTPPITEIYTLSLHDALPIYEIGNHRQNHKELTTLGQNAIHTEITESADKIQQATGIWPHLVRPPYGAYDNDIINHAINNENSLILWSIDSLDWQSRNAASVN